MSSIKDGVYYRNRTIYHLPKGRKGAFSLLGGEEISLQTARRIPNDVFVFIEYHPSLC